MNRQQLEDQYLQDLTEKEKARIRDLVLATNHIRLCTIDAAIDTANRELCGYKTDLNKMEAAEIIDGIELRILNKLQRIGKQNQSEIQAEVFALYRVDEVQLRTHRFRSVIEEMIVHRTADLKRLETVRAVFVEIYPEATTSPRLSRLELSESPNRYSLPPKYRSTSSLSSKLPSPRKLLSRTKSSDQK